jgi:hypothetical protein
VLRILSAFKFSKEYVLILAMSTVGDFSSVISPVSGLLQTAVIGHSAITKKRQKRDPEMNSG